jgi:hypothetical protein
MNILRFWSARLYLWFCMVCLIWIEEKHRIKKWCSSMWKLEDKNEKIIIQHIRWVYVNNTHTHFKVGEQKCKISFVCALFEEFNLTVNQLAFDNITISMACPRHLNLAISCPFFYRIACSSFSTYIHEVASCARASGAACAQPIFFCPSTSSPLWPFPLFCPQLIFYHVPFLLYFKDKKGPNVPQCFEL